jgi:hypothetical protein
MLNALNKGDFGSSDTKKSARKTKLFNERRTGRTISSLHDEYSLPMWIRAESFWNTTISSSFSNSENIWTELFFGYLNTIKDFSFLFKRNFALLKWLAQLRTFCIPYLSKKPIIS